MNSESGTRAQDIGAEAAPEDVPTPPEERPAHTPAEALEAAARGADVELATTPPNPDPMPQRRRHGGYDLDHPDVMLNRELTWLGFNFRVLSEAADVRNPILERVKFLSITSSNLDEFFMKRIGGLKQQVGAGITDRTVDGRTPQEQIDDSLELVRKLTRRREVAYRDVLEQLARHHIEITECGDLPEGERDLMRRRYMDSIYPLVTPQATDPAHPFPFISNLSLNLLVTLRYENGEPAPLTRVKVPVGSGIPRFLALPDRRTFVPIESVLANNLDMLFPGMVVESCSLFRVTRNSNTETAEEHADDLMSMIETELQERRFAPIVRLQVGPGMDPDHRSLLIAELGLEETTDVFEVDGMLGMRDLMELTEIQDSNLHLAPHYPVDHPLLTSDRNVFHVIRDAGSLLVHHPYQSYVTSVERFLRDAARDPKVRAIKMTLYRTSQKSKAIDHLIEAAQNGKQVAAVVEIKARFDEQANIRWAERLEEAGIHVTYGVVGLKTHCKVVLVVRSDYTGLHRYAHIGTGNYHAVTARQYADLSLLTSDFDVGSDLTELFNYLTTGFKPKREYRRIVPSPKQLKNMLLERIQDEIEHHTAKSPGHIRIKTNALEDADVTRALYRASMAGVQVDLLVRDTCRLRPGIPGLSENVRVVSIVGRFLEHARIYYFRAGGKNLYFIGSADCMTRNLQSRVETLVEVREPWLERELRFVLQKQFDDQRSAWEMRPDGSYVQRRPTSSRQRSCQEVLVAWATKRHREATRLKRRKTQGLTRRNIR
jgi:polyphosphate kinase